MTRRPSAYQKHRRELAKRRGYLVPTQAKPANDALRPGERQFRENLRYGRDLEHRAVEAFASGDLPDWYVSVRPATQAEDAAGVDLWIHTNRGWIAVQVKSSAARASLFREKHPGMEVAVVVLHMTMDDKRIRARVLEAVERIWRRKYVRRAA